MAVEKASSELRNSRKEERGKVAEGTSSVLRRNAGGKREAAAIAMSQADARSRPYARVLTVRIARMAEPYSNGPESPRLSKRGMNGPTFWGVMGWDIQ